jgi:parallel beta-helix repeat protein
MALTKATFSMVSGAYVNVMDYNVKGDGTTNDTVAIQKVLKDFAGINTVFFPAGTYMVAGDAILSGNVQKAGIQIPSNSSLVFANGAQFQLITTTATTYNVLCIYNVSNVKITGGTLIGDTDHHSPGAVGSEFNGIGLRIQGATNVYVNGMSAQKMYADGFAIVYDDVTSPFPSSKNVVLENCSSTYNYRNGLSVIGCIDGAVLGGAYSYNGQATQAGVGDGIDIEPNQQGSMPSAPQVSNYLVSNVNASYNRTQGLHIYGQGTYPNQGVANNIQFVSNRLVGNSSSIATYQATNVVISDNTTSGSSFNCIVIDSSQNVSIDNNILSNAAVSGIATATTGLTSKNIVISNNTISNVGYYGILVADLISSVIQNNTVYASSQDSDSAYDNIYAQNLDQSVISGNMAYKGDGAKKARYGINIDSASSNNNIYGNMLINAGQTRPVVNAGSNNTFSNNTFAASFSVAQLYVTVYQYASSASAAKSISVTVCGTDGTNAFQDQIVFGSASSATVVVVSASTLSGTPAARSYNTGVYSNSLVMTMATGTYTVVTQGTER